MAESKGRKALYEAMFLVSQAEAHDFGSIVEHIKDILTTRGHVDMIAMRKWDERRLAYEIKGQKRGVYFLVYFEADPVHIEPIERACNISERIMRVLLTRADHLTREEMASFDGAQELADEAKLRAARAAEAEAKAAAEATAQPIEAAEATA
ncbi:MAG: 30S ribosomal protein S6 [Phycisphaerales bacterium]|nr:30S ribosomal protein S6 [Phycisphaerales bacterium]